MQGLRFCLDRGTALYVAKMLDFHEPLTRFHSQMHRDLADALYAFYEADPYEDANGSSIPFYEAVRTYTAAQARVGNADDH